MPAPLRACGHFLVPKSSLRRGWRTGARALCRGVRGRRLQPKQQPADGDEELAMNIASGRDHRACPGKCREAKDLGERLAADAEPLPPTEHPVLPEHIAELLDNAHYNLSD